MEVKVQTQLEEGSAIDLESIEEMIKLQIASAKAATKGFVLDLDFSEKAGKTWFNRIRDGRLFGDLTLTHIVDLVLDETEVALRAKNIRQNADTGVIFSKWERDEIRKPKPVKLDENGDPIEEEEPDEDDENAPPKLPSEAELLTRACDEKEAMVGEVEHFMREQKDFDDLINQLYDSTYVKVDIAGLNP